MNKQSPPENSAVKERFGYNGVEDRLYRLLGEAYRKYRDEWVKAGSDYVPDFPVHIDFELVDECNMRCGFCPRNRKTHPSLPYEVNTKSLLSDEVMKKILEEVASEPLYSVNFAIGEPLLDSRLFHWISAFHKAGVVDSRVNTNGLLLDRYVNDIFESGLVNLYVSLDAADRDMHTQQRGYGYDRVVHGLSLVLAEKQRRGSVLPIVRVSFVDTVESHHQLDKFKAMWSSKVDHIDVQIYQNLNKFQPSGSRKLWNCVDPFRRVSIMANGNIDPCCTFQGKMLAVGNVKDCTVREAWQSKKMQLVRRRLLDDLEPICVACQESV